jgi:hypothetical protein
MNYNNPMTMQDLQGIQPVFQNATAQQQLAQQAMAQGGQLASQALGTPQQIQMANALRKSQPKSDTDFLTNNYTAPSVGINPNANIGYNIDSTSSYGLK